VPSGRYPTVVVRPTIGANGPFLALQECDFFGGAMMQATELNRQICSAITRRSLVMFEYGDLIRVVEPHRFGMNSAGHSMLSGWLRAGYSRSDPAGGWRNYLLSDISAFQLLDAPFAGTRPGYAAHDARMREVYCELTPSAVEAPVDGPYIVREPMASTKPAPEAQARDARQPDETATRIKDADPPDLIY
jgi:hypothetical protein